MFGQSRHVFAYRTTARNTVEERVVKLQERKRTVTAAILTPDNSVRRPQRDFELPQYSMAVLNAVRMLSFTRCRPRDSDQPQCQNTASLFRCWKPTERIKAPRFARF